MQMRSALLVKHPVLPLLKYLFSLKFVYAYFPQVGTIYSSQVTKITAFIVNINTVEYHSIIVEVSYELHTWSSLDSYINFFCVQNFST